jgi:hypothetical protein
MRRRNGQADQAGLRIDAAGWKHLSPGRTSGTAPRQGFGPGRQKLRTRQRFSILITKYHRIPQGGGICREEIVQDQWVWDQ